MKRIDNMFVFQKCCNVEVYKAEQYLENNKYVEFCDMSYSSGTFSFTFSLVLM